MSDELPPAGALRLARVAGVPVYLDRTWLLLGAFVAWTGWQAGRDLGTGTRPRVRRLARRRHPRSPCSATRSPTRWRPGCSGSGCTASSRPSGAVTPPTTGPAPPRRAPPWSPSPGPLANLALAAVGARRGRDAAVAGIRVRALVHLPQPAARRLQPAARAARSTAASSCSRWSGGVSGRRDLGLVVAGWCGRVLAVGVALWYVASRWPRAAPTCSASASRWSWPGSSGPARPRPSSARPLERLLLRVRPEDVMDPVAVVPALTPVGELVGIGRRVVALDERGLPDPAPARAVGDRARHRHPAAVHPAGLARRQAARRVRRRARPGRRRRAGAAGDGDHRVGRGRRDLGAARCAGW